MIDENWYDYLSDFLPLKTYLKDFQNFFDKIPQNKSLNNEVDQLNKLKEKGKRRNF